METDFQILHENEQFSTQFSMLPNDDEIMKEQLGISGSLKQEDFNSWTEESILNPYAVGKEDFQQIMSDWQQHIGSLQACDVDDINLDNLDLLNVYPSGDFFGEIAESPILSKALTCQPQTSLVDTHLPAEPFKVKKDLNYENRNEFNESSFSSNRSFSSPVKTEPTIVRKLTLINGEKEILGKNIIGLHCLNEIKENPDENCQTTSTVINGKRYKIIIKPKSQKVKKMSNEKFRKSLIKKLSQCTLVPKMEPKEDELISEMCNGNYDVPILGSDLLTGWDMTNLDTELTNLDSDLNTLENDILDFQTVSNSESPKKVPPLRIKIPKIKKSRKKKSEGKSDNEEVDVETVSDKTIEANSLKELIEEFEENSTNPIKTEDIKEEPNEKAEGNEEYFLSNENIKKSLPKEMINQIEALKYKKEGRIPLIQNIPTKKAVKSGTRMQDAAATMNRNKLLKIVSGGDTVQLDHDYCTSLLKNSESAQKKSPVTDSSANLTEKNPKKDSGLESGDVSDASEEPHTPESLQNIQSMKQMNSKLLEERRRGKNHVSITKVAAAFFRATNAATSNSNSNSNNSDTLKTMTVSNGNKALTNEPESLLKPESDSCDLVPSNSNSVSNIEGAANTDAKSNDDCDSKSEQPTIQKTERPKKKLKLEEYLSRRNEKGRITSDNSSSISSDSSHSPSNSNISESENNIDNKTSNDEQTIVKPEPSDSPVDAPAASKVPEKLPSKKEETKKPDKCKERKKDNEEPKKTRYSRNRSSSSSSGEREREDRRSRRRSRSRSVSRSRSRSSWRESSSRRNSIGRRRNRRSTSRDRRRGFWSRSVSRSSSRESSSSSDRSGRWRRSPVRYRRRSRSRSISRDRARSRNRGYSNRRRQYGYFNRNVNSRRSRSPYRIYSVREKQRQIEERRVIYVGRIEEEMTKSKLRERFSLFGPIIDISLHFRDHGDNYGFVTYAHKSDAYDAVEHGNDDPTLPRYDLCFGGRRGFCKERYADLDGMPTSYSGFNDAPIVRSTEESFDLLLKEAQAKLKKRKQSSNS